MKFQIVSSSVDRLYGWGGELPRSGPERLGLTVSMRQSERLRRGMVGAIIGEGYLLCGLERAAVRVYQQRRPRRSFPIGGRRNYLGLHGTDYYASGSK